MALTSASTLAQIEAQYMDNLMYEASYAKACLFVEACRAMLAKFDRSGTVAGKSWVREDINKQLEKAEAKMEALEASASSSNRVMFTRGRMVRI